MPILVHSWALLSAKLLLHCNTSSSIRPRVRHDGHGFPCPLPLLPLDPPLVDLLHVNIITWRSVSAEQLNCVWTFHCLCFGNSWKRISVPWQTCNRRHDALVGLFAPYNDNLIQRYNAILLHESFNRPDQWLLVFTSFIAD